jgi:ribosome biogenesis GTPase / thiamine phosphate phosphatase
MSAGIVIKSTGSWFTVRTGEGNNVACKIKGNYRIKGIRATNPVTVGDKVQFTPNADGTGIIHKIEERKNYIIRRASNLSREYQLVAANVDQAFLVASLSSPKTFPEFIDRFLVSAEAYSIPTILLFNKSDIYTEAEREELKALMDVYTRIGYGCLEVSAKTGLNTQLLRDMMKGRLSVFSGNSGVGKSTLINLLDPSLGLRTSEISEAHLTGKHTTTFSEMFELYFGGYIIDTPGIRGFGLIDFGKDELFHYFPEIFRASHNCRFYNCSHLHEPGCAVIEAVEKGDISRSRYLSYLSMLEDDEEKYR